MAQEPKSSNHWSYCDLCEETTDIQWKCIQCMQILCKQCHKTHKNGKITKNHFVFNKTDALKEKHWLSLYKCQKHTNDIVFYCRDDKKCLCQKCMLSDHNGHNIEEVSEYGHELYLKFKQDIEEETAAASKQTPNHDKSSSASDEEFQANRNDNTQTINAKGTEYWQKNIQKIRKWLHHANQLLMTLDAAKSKKDKIHRVVHEAISDLPDVELIQRQDELKAKVTEFSEARITSQMLDEELRNQFQTLYDITDSSIHGKKDQLIKNYQDMKKEIGQCCDGIDMIINENTYLMRKSEIPHLKSTMGTKDDDRVMELKEKLIWLGNCCKQLKMETQKMKTDVFALCCEKANLTERFEASIEKKELEYNNLLQIHQAMLQEKNGKSTLENDPDIPTELAEKFSEIYDNEWTDAFEELYDMMGGGEISTIGVLLQTLKYVYETAVDDVISYEKSIRRAPMLVPTSYSGMNEADSTAEQHILEEFYKDLQHQKTVSEMMLSCGKLCSESFSKKMLMLCKTQDTPNTNARHALQQPSPKFRFYIVECAKICWLMRLRSPPMHLTFETGEQFDGNIFKQYTKSGKLIHYLVWPYLQLHANGPLLAKGVAQPY